MAYTETIIVEPNTKIDTIQKALYVNQKCRWFERFILSKETDNVVII